MSRSKLILLVSIICGLSFIACTEPSIQDDAKKAAELSIESNTAAMENNLSSAGSLYNDVQAIMNKYRENGKFDEFYQLYNGYLQENAMIEDAMIETTSPPSNSAPSN